LPIEIVGVGDDLKMTRQAAIYKATYRVAYADAFAAALAKERRAELVTGDPEFKRLEKEIKVNWLK
jgi:predicted nucleic acid-binding protein